MTFFLLHLVPSPFPSSFHQYYFRVPLSWLCRFPLPGVYHLWWSWYMQLAHIPHVRFHHPPATSVCFPRAPLRRLGYIVAWNLAFIPLDYPCYSCIITFLCVYHSRQHSAFVCPPLLSLAKPQSLNHCPSLLSKRFLLYPFQSGFPLSTYLGAYLLRTSPSQLRPVLPLDPLFIPPFPLPVP